MHIAIIVVIAIHLLAGVYWAGSTFVVACSSGGQARTLFRSQMIAAVLTVAAGVFLWIELIGNAVGPAETSLSIGAACAIVAAGFQGSMRKRPVLGQRVAAVLLAAAVVAMAIAPYLT
ncbi:MAG: hypothetical protein ACREU3_01300 [Steroidobacteraceae bacterium]